jgi:REP element-mobilizing transposase RayT
LNEWCIAHQIFHSSSQASATMREYMIMKIEYNNLYTHFVFTTLGRQPLILEKNRGRIEKYITGIVNNNSCKLYAIYANPEHVHFLVSRSPDMSEESLATIVAESCRRFINENKLALGMFGWQNTASAFSVSKSDVDKVCKYILNQPEHHRKVTFAEEFKKFIKYYQMTLQRNKVIR